MPILIDSTDGHAFACRTILIDPRSGGVSITSPWLNILSSLVTNIAGTVASVTLGGGMLAGPLGGSVVPIATINVSRRGILTNPPEINMDIQGATVRIGPNIAFNAGLSLTHAGVIQFTGPGTVCQDLGDGRALIRIPQGGP